MKVQDIMTRQVISVTPETSVTAVARLLRENAISGIPVVDDDFQVVGIVTEVDLVARHARPHFPAYVAFLDSIIYLESRRRYRESMRRILATTAGELMTHPVTTVAPETDVQDLASLMVEKRVNPVPVVDEDGYLIGIASHTDLLRLIEEAVSAEAQAAQEEAAAGDAEEDAGP
jgi:CBS domain-containing protein